MVCPERVVSGGAPCWKNLLRSWQSIWLVGRGTVPVDPPLTSSLINPGVLGNHVYNEAARSWEFHIRDDSYHELRRHG